MKKSYKNLELQKKIMIDKLKNEITNLEYEIQNPKKIETTRNAIKSLKISLKIAQYIAPYVLITTVTLVGFCAVGLTPFHKDDKKAYLETKKEKKA